MGDPKFCPDCGKSNIENWIRCESEDVGWDAGLGSPGKMWFEIAVHKCRSCGKQWEG